MTDTNFGLGFWLEELRPELMQAFGEIKEHVDVGLSMSRLSPGTVLSTAASGKPTVQLDAPAGTEVSSSSGVPCMSVIGPQPTGARVMVLYDPPSGFYVVGSATNQPPWNTEWGKIYSNGPQAADMTPITTIQDLPGFSATWLAVSGRRYRTTGWSAAGSTVSGDILYGWITDGSNNRLRRYFAAPGQGTFQIITLGGWHEDVGAGATLTRKLRFERNSGSGTVNIVGESSSIGAGTRILVEDIGPA